MKSRFLLGVSLVALAATLAPVKADEILSTNPSGVVIDFPVNGSVINPASSMLGSIITRPNAGLRVDDYVSRDVVNNGAIYATGYGIYATTGTIGRSLINNGHINVEQDEASEFDGVGYNSAYGIAHTGYNESLSGTNNGSIAVSIDTERDGGYAGYGDGYGASQILSGYDDLSAEYENTGSVDVDVRIALDVSEDATADYGNVDVTASAFGIHQDVYVYDGGGNARGSIKNSGSVNVSAIAEAIAGGYVSGYATGYAEAEGIDQIVRGYGGSVDARVVNSGTVTSAALSIARASQDAEFAAAWAYATAEAIEQHVYASGGNARADVTNSGALSVEATAEATGGVDVAQSYGGGHAYAYATGIDQNVSQGQGYPSEWGASASVRNTGSINAEATARVFAPEDPSYYTSSEHRAESTANGVRQQIDSGGDAVGDLRNSGAITVRSFAEANGGGGFYSYSSFDAEAYADGLDQEISSYRDVNASINNAASINVLAEAEASSFGYEDAEAYADAVGIEQELWGYGGDASGVGAVTNAAAITVRSVATATSDYFSGTGDATPYASGFAAGIDQYSYNFAFATLDATNNGTISVSAEVHATGSSARAGDANEAFEYHAVVLNAVADGAIAIGIAQAAAGYDDIESNLRAVNNGDIVVYSEAIADSDEREGSVSAGAGAFGVLQGFHGYGSGAVTAINNDDIVVVATAEAIGDWDSWYTTAFAEADAFGIAQFVNADGEAAARAINTGHISVSSNATSETYYGGSGNSSAVGIGQTVNSDFDDVAADATNDGVLVVVASGVATRTSGSVDPDSGAYMTSGASGISQQGEGPYNVILNATNTSLISSAANARAVPESDADGRAGAYAYAAGIEQTALDAGTTFAWNYDDYVGSRMTATNSGDIIVETAASSVGGEHSQAGAYASGVGIAQYQGLDAFAGNEARIENRGAVTVSSFSTVDAYESDPDDVISGRAEATAIGSLQQVMTSANEHSNFSWLNEGTYQVFASAGYHAGGSYDFSNSVDNVAVAYGAVVGGENTGHTVELDYVNAANGVVWVAADVATQVEDVSVEAHAFGMYFASDALEGSVRNDGLILAWVDESSDAYAPWLEAVGVTFKADINNATFSNRGTIGAVANTDGGAADLTAIGIHVLPYDAGDEGYELDGGATFTLVNDGGFVFGMYALDGPDDEFRLGEAIRLETEADQEIDAQLKGNDRDGYLIGDVTYANPQTFTVLEGKTQYLGNWGDGTGRVSVEEDGVFHLINRNDEYTLGQLFGMSANLDSSVDQAVVMIDTFDLNQGGTLSIGLGPVQGVNSTGHVDAKDADVDDGVLKGHFIAAYYNPATPEWIYDDVLIADNDFGTFAEVVSNTPLMQVTASYNMHAVDTDRYTADLIATRVAFDQVDGLTENQRQVAAAIEDRYDKLTDTNYKDMNDFEQMIARIFTLDGTKSYQDALDMFSAEPYAATMADMLWSFGPLQWVLADRIGGGGVAAGGPLGYADEKVNSPANDAIITGSLQSHERASLWLRPFGSWGDQTDGSSIALDHTAQQYGIYGGGDVTVGNGVFGLAGGFLSSSLGFQDGSKVSYSGFQVAGYGRVDLGAMYLRGVAAGGFYENKGTRLYESGTFSADSAYASRAGNVYGEVGFNGLSAGTSSLTPFAGVGYSFGSQDGFTETGGGPGNLVVDAATGSAIVTSLGAQWNSQLTIGDKPVRTSVRAAWEHRFGDGFAGINANFANPNAPEGIGFTSTSGHWANDFAVVGASGTVDLTPATEFTLRYDGRFSTDFLSNTVSGSFRQKF